MSSDVSLAVLLSRVLIAYTRDWEAVDDGTAYQPTLLNWSNFLRPVGEDGVLLTEAHKAARLSRRTMRMILQNRRWFVIEPGLEGRGTQRVHLTEAGCVALDVGRTRCEVVEAAWRQRFGVAAVEQLRTSLEALVRSVDLELPHYPTPYGAADGSITGGDSAAAKEGSVRIPAHGRDWPVVIRSAGDTTSDLPLSALLSQVLVAFSIDYDAASEVSDMTRTGMLALLARDGVPAALIPRKWEDALEGQGLIEVERDARRRRKHVRLTQEGERLHMANQDCIADVERAWRSRYGVGVVDALRSSLGAIDGALDPTLPDQLVVVFVGGFGYIVVLSPW